MVLTSILSCGESVTLVDENPKEENDMLRSFWRICPDKKNEFRESIQMANRAVKTRSFQSSGKRRSNSQRGVTSYPLEWLLAKRRAIPGVGEDMEEREALCTASRNVNWGS